MSDQDDSYVICVRNDIDPASEFYLTVGERYHVEEAFNQPEDGEMDETWERILKEFPNPFFYLKEVTATCDCCGNRIDFWHGLFKTKEQLQNEGTLEEITQKSGTKSKSPQTESLGEATCNFQISGRSAEAS